MDYFDPNKYKTLRKASYHIGIDYLHRLLSCRLPSKHYCLLKVRFPGEHTREDATDTP